MSAAAVSAAMAVAAPQACADVLQLAPHEQSVTMPDGWELTVGHQQESGNRVAPLNVIGSTREVFVTNQSYGGVGGSGSALKGVVLKAGYHLGCAVDITSVTLGVQFSAGFQPGITISPTTPMGVTALPSPSATVAIGPSAAVTPTFSVTLTPGQVVDLPMGEKPLEGPKAYITNRDAHVKMDGCIGPAAIRSYTIVAAQSSAADDSVAVYGDPIAL
ncbi:MspA family porin [Nocardia mexicana]|uniref:MspA family porin n=1 Tax=Nocardia mexicana TaxID=279262 RepID=UPI00147096A4|nr:MspA family porin [Nocardia mexicana]